MKNNNFLKDMRIMLFIAIVALTGFAMLACSDGSGTNRNPGGNPNDNPGGNNNQTPTASDYDIANLDQKHGNVIAVTITAKSGMSPGALSNIRYAGNTEVPQTIGTYAVYFSVAAATGWNAAPDIFAGNLVIDKYYIGDTGPGGGIVFYDKGSVSNGWRYLEAAPVNHGALRWSSSDYATTLIAGTEAAIGTGKANTAAILAVDANAPAAKACASYREGGKDDWFLPSIDELNEMYKARSYLGMSSDTFWSSSQYSNYRAWGQHFGHGYQDYTYKDYGYRFVRAVRAF